MAVVPPTQERSLIPFLLLSTTQSICRLVKSGQSQQIQKPAGAHKDDEHPASIF